MQKTKAQIKFLFYAEKFYLTNSQHGNIIYLRRGDEAEMAGWFYQKDGDIFKCSHCGGRVVRNVYPYCPWCGSAMTGEMNNGREKRIYINRIYKTNKHKEFEKYFIACIRKEDGVQGMYDVVGQKFYPVTIGEAK